MAGVPDELIAVSIGKRKLPKEVQTAGVIIIGALLTAILLKIALSKKKSIALGGINKKNIKKIKLINAYGFSGISYFLDKI